MPAVSGILTRKSAVFNTALPNNFVLEFLDEVLLHCNHSTFHFESEAILLCHITLPFLFQELIISSTVQIL